MMKVGEVLVDLAAKWEVRTEVGRLANDASLRVRYLLNLLVESHYLDLTCVRALESHTEANVT